MAIVVITPPSDLPVTAVDARAQLRIDFEDDDVYLESKIREAVEFVQAWTGFQLMPATMQQLFDNFGGAQHHHIGPPGIWIGGGGGLFGGMYHRQPLKLEVQPVTAVSEITYFDLAGELQTLDPTSYWTSLVSYPRIVPKTFWPRTEIGHPDAVTVGFSAGFADADSVPERFKAAILMYVALRYEIRTPVVINQYAREVPYGLEELCERLSVGGYS